MSEFVAFVHPASIDGQAGISDESIIGGMKVVPLEQMTNYPQKQAEIHRSSGWSMTKGVG